ncbi:MAG: hypothetical protein PHT88_04590 [Candidatus Moranbacteria bacterium]|nr:hypothetical protein [Candidatus Moranbacteria bacterium]
MTLIETEGDENEQKALPTFTIRGRPGAGGGPGDLPGARPMLAQQAPESVFYGLSGRCEMRLAKYKNIRVDYEVITDDWCAEHRDYVRLTEFVDIEFPPLPEDAVITQEVAVLDRQIAAIQEQAMVEIQQLAQRKQELLALNAPGETA